MKKNHFLRIVMLIIVAGFCWVENSSAQENKVYTTPTVMPSYPSGKNGLAQFLKQNVKYPAAADSAKIKGIVTVGFIVEKTGGLSSLTIVNGLAGGCETEALRVVRKMPKWNPGTVANKPVRVSYKLAIKFPQ